MGRIVVTGGAGFLGTHVVERLRARGEEVFVPRGLDYDLTQEENVKRLYADVQPERVIHLAAKVGGIGANQVNPGKFYYDNLIMGALMMEHARQNNVQKFLAVATICSYPKNATIPFKEESIWDGYPEETNAPYGLAKKMLLVQSQAYRQQYGFNSVVLFPVNLYGPNDNFDLETSHVIPALIRKFAEAKENGEQKVVLWGTGGAYREFLFVEDAASGIVRAFDKYNKSDPVNLGTGKSISIEDLAGKIARIIGFEGEIEWDTTKPDGQPLRCLDTEKAFKEFSWRYVTEFDEGLKKTIYWYLGERHGRQGRST